MVFIKEVGAIQAQKEGKIMSGNLKVVTDSELKASVVNAALRDAISFYKAEELIHCLGLRNA